jgi:predicted MFS family arabinose efflux permease
MRPVRTIAVAGALSLFLLAFTDHTHSPCVVLFLVVISVLAQLDNGLEATAITEFVGPFWGGRALGVQNTTQRLAAAAGSPLFGAVITAFAFPPAWAVCGLFPLLAVALVPADLVPTGIEIRAGQRSVR